MDISGGDSLNDIVVKIQRWINKFKEATGIRVSSDFSYVNKINNVDSNDTVDSALRKVQGYLNFINGNFWPKEKGMWLKVKSAVNVKSVSLNSYDNIVTCYNYTESIFVILPSTPRIGNVVIVVRMSVTRVQIASASDIEISLGNVVSSYITLDSAGDTAIMFYDGHFWTGIIIKHV